MKLSSKSQYILSFILLAFLLLYIFSLSKQTLTYTAQAGNTPIIEDSNVATASSDNYLLELTVASATTPSYLKNQRMNILLRVQNQIVEFLGVIQKQKAEDSQKLDKGYSQYLK